MPIPLGILAVAGAGAAGGASSFDLLESVVISSQTGPITISSIPQTYKHLRFVAVGRSADNFTGVSGWFRFNSDSSTSYVRHILNGSGSSVTSGASTNQDRINVPVWVGNTGASGNFSVYIMDILDYSSTNKNKTARILGGTTTNFAGIQLISALYTKTDAITSITAESSASDFVAGSRFSLYGIK